MIRLQTVPAVRGAVWVRQGFATMARHPTAFALLLITFYVALAVLSLLPAVGLFAVLALLPLRSLGFMLATRQSLQKRMPTPRVFVEPLRGPRPQVAAILQLGALYALAVILVFWLGDVVDGGALESFWQTAWQADNNQALEAKWAEPALQNGLMFRLAMVGVLALPFWHAPALTHWGGQSAGRALFFSCLACWRNKAAFAAYGLAWIGLGGLLGLGAGLLGLLFEQSAVVNVALMAACLITMTAFFVSLWFTFSDCFSFDEVTGPTSASEALT